MRNIWPFLAVAAILYVMYATKLGVPGIRQYWMDFKLLDMQFGYSAETVSITQKQLGADGIRHYLYYFGVDVCFIIALFFAQSKIEGVFTSATSGWGKGLWLLALSRGVFDLAEDALLTFILKNKLPICIVPIASVATIFKFICLFGWGILMILILIRKQM